MSCSGLLVERGSSGSGAGPGKGTGSKRVALLDVLAFREAGKTLLSEKGNCTSRGRQA